MLGGARTIRQSQVAAISRSLATQVPLPPKDYTSITPPYAALEQKLDQVRKGINKPLTLAEKILYSHLHDVDAALQTGIKRGESYLQLSPERVAMQDASAQCVSPTHSIMKQCTYTTTGWLCMLFQPPQLAFSYFIFRLQFMSAGLGRSAVPTSIHCDHLIQANTGAKQDLVVCAQSGDNVCVVADNTRKRSIDNNREVFDFLESAAKKYGIEFWKPGSGIIHQIVLENYAAPGMLMSVIYLASICVVLICF